MNRLNQKCVVASTGVHLLIGLAVIVGPAFTSSTPKPVQDLPLINFEPDFLTDADASGGGNPNAGRRPAAVVQPQPQPQPQPVVQPKPPEPPSRPQFEVAEPTKPQPAPDSFDTTPPKQRKAPQVSVALQSRPNPRNSNNAAEEKAREREVADARNRMRDAFKQAADNIRTGAGSATAIEEGSFGPGGGGAAYANYKAWVWTKFNNAWLAPEDTSVTAAIAKVRVVIARDGTVLSAEFISRSGDSQVDASIQRALDRVPTIGKPFPEGAKESKRSYIIPFDLKVKRGLA